MCELDGAWRANGCGEWLVRGGADGIGRGVLAAAAAWPWGMRHRVLGFCVLFLFLISGKNKSGWGIDEWKDVRALFLFVEVMRKGAFVSLLYYKYSEVWGGACGRAHQ